ncbi:MAG: DUF4145 domain-containing protein [Planctomycetes bacterium]|nr:DUF4145 domain-containing protein [Planctomycetota bacterium]
MYISANNDPQIIADKHFTVKCPHCNARAGVSLVSAPRWEYLHRFRPAWVGMAYRCDACNEPVFLKFRITSLGDPVLIDEQPVEIQRAAETFELSYLPSDVASDFGEALTCYSHSCWNAFAAMCRRALQSAALVLGTEGSTKVQQQIESLHAMGVVDDEAFTQLKAIMLTGHDGAHPHLPKLSSKRCTVLLELMKDALYQLFVRKAKIEEAARLRKEAIQEKKP